MVWILLVFMGLSGFQLLSWGVRNLVDRKKLPGTEYNNPEKFRMEMLFYQRTISTLVLNIFLVVAIGMLILARSAGI